MAITPQAGYTVDPTNPNAVVKAAPTAMPGSVASIQQPTQSISYGAVNTQPIPMSTLTQNTPIPTPVPLQTDTNNYQGILDTAKNQVLAIQDQLKTQATEQAKVAESAQTPAKSDSMIPQWVTDLKNSLMGNIPQADTSLGSAYENDYSQQIDPIVQQRAEAQKIQKQAEFELNSVNAEIQGIYDSAKAQQLALVGQGRGRTTDFLDAQSAKIGRNAAIQVLPLQSKALVASAKVAFAQGNVELAQQSLSDAKDKLNTVFQYKAQDAENTYKNKMAMWDRLYQVANDAQQQALEEKKMQIEEQRYQQTEFNNLQQSYVDAAFNAGDYATASRLASAKTPEELSRLVGNIKPVVKSTGSSSAGLLGSLPVSIQGKIIAQSDKFGTSDIVKKFNSVVDSINVVNGISSTSQNPADHQAIVYAFAKALDPDSAVKEGEYETIKKYAQSLVSKYGKEFTNAINGTGFLSEQAIQNIQTTMNNLYTSRKPQYDNAYAETARVMDNIAGMNISGDLLKDYSKGVSNAGGQVVGDSGTTSSGVKYTIVGGTSPATPAPTSQTSQTTPTTSYKSLLPDFSDYKGFSLGSFFK